MAADSFKGDSLRQRLVGGVALLIIGVIAWFWLLSADSPVDPVSRTTQIPPAPEIKPFSVPEPTPPADVAPIGSERESEPAMRADIDGDKAVPAAAAPAGIVPSKNGAVSNAPPGNASTVAASNRAVTAKPKAAAEPSTSAKPKPDAFELDQHGLPVAWIIQVGLFSSQASADKIKAELQEKGFKAYTEAYRTASAPAGVKVFVGPKLSRERADEQKRAIDAALKVNSMVVRFQSPQR